MAATDSDLLNKLITKAGTHGRAEAILRVLSTAAAEGQEVGSAEVLTAWADVIKAADVVRDPRTGDAMILRGTIMYMTPDLGTAYVRIYGAVPGQTCGGGVVVSLGQLEHDTAADLFDDLFDDGLPEWKPGDPVYPDESVDESKTGRCSDPECGVTWTPTGPVECPRCGAPAAVDV